MSNKIKIYCVTNKKINFIKQTEYNLSWVGKETPPNNYIKCDEKNNIFFKEKYYSELTFHYWYWKNLLGFEPDNKWIGFCQKRRYWLKNNATKEINKNNINENLLIKLDDDCESIICNPMTISGAKKIKIMKRGWRNVMKDPSILFLKKKQNIALHFDMHHGFGNFNKAINLLESNDRKDFYDYVNSRTQFNPHIMFITKKKIMNNWFESLFPWLERCEKVFGFDDLKGYDTMRLYAFLAERYLSFWFKKYTKYKEQPWVFINE